jgi:hypothetical protein
VGTHGQDDGAGYGPEDEAEEDAVGEAGVGVGHSRC